MAEYYVTDKEGKKKDKPQHTSKVKASKTAKVNYMTIPQLRAANEILKKKMGELKEGDHVRDKLQALSNEYTQAERQINKYYQKYANNPHAKHLVQGKKNILTIAQINGKNYTGGKDKTKYGVGDWMRDVRANKIALGVGIASIGLGTTAHLVSKFAGKSLTSLIGEALKIIWKNNPAATIAVLGGAALIAASAICPAVKRTAKRISNNKAAMSAAKNDVAQETYKDDLDFNNIKSMESRFYDDPELANNLNLEGLTQTQRDNYYEAMKQARQKQQKKTAEAKAQETTEEQTQTTTEEQTQKTEPEADSTEKQGNQPTGMSPAAQKYVTEFVTTISGLNNKTAIKNFIDKIEADKSLSNEDLEMLKAMVEARKAQEQAWAQKAAANKAAKSAETRARTTEEPANA